MTSRELLYVKTVAEEKSISKAAKKLFIAQPSLSQSLQRIEENLGTALFNRTSVGLTLTYAGERYYQISCQILRIYEDFESEISDLNELRTGRIHMGITNHLSTLILPKVLPSFKKLYPAVEIFISEGNSEILEQALLAGEISFAIHHAPKQNSHPMLNYETLNRDPFVIALSSDHPLIKKAQERECYKYPVLDLKLLENEPFIMLNKQQRIRHVTDDILTQAQITPDIILTLRNYETAQSLAGKGVGVTFLPSDYTSISSSDQPPTFLSIDSMHSPYWELCVSTLRGGYLSRADQYFLSMIRENVSEHH